MAGIHSAIIKVMGEVGAIAKNTPNPQQGYKYRGIDAVMNALQPALIKNKVYVTPTVLEQEREERATSKGGLLIYTVLKVKYTFYTEDGSSVECIVTGEGMDSGDKSSNKAMSAAFKYACFQTFCIPTDEMIDSESDSPEPAPKKQTKQKSEPKNTANNTPDTDNVDIARANLKGLLEQTESDVALFLTWCSKAFQREVTSVDELSIAEVNHAIKEVEKKKGVA